MISSPTSWIARWREALARARLARLDSGPRLRIAAMSTPELPVIAHGFVYQELTSMQGMLGADVKLFHHAHTTEDGIHPDFAPLLANAEFVRPSARTHRADIRYWQTRSPREFDRLMGALCEHSGLSRDALAVSFDLSIAFTYARRLEAWRARYVHTYFFYNAALCGLVSSWLLGIPRGLTAYADHVLRDWPLKVVPLHLRTATVVVATSHRIAEELAKIGGDQLRARLVVKPNAVDLSRFAVAAPRSDVATPLRLIVIARIDRKKGLHDLVQAIALLAARKIDVRARILGAADPRNPDSMAAESELRESIRALGVQDRVELTGQLGHARVVDSLAQSDVFVAPFVETTSGDKDGIPTAMLEAMASGLPVIATRTGSLGEAFDDGVEGITVPPRDPSALADAIAQLASEPAMREAMGRAARARVEREFDVQVAEPRLHARITAAVGTNATQDE
ncbi:MAG: glycosyltransferase family 4 protein [Planctomycetota bacterium]